MKLIGGVDLNYNEVLENARKNIGSNCKVCFECNGKACKGVIPGPGGKGTGIGFVRNYEDLKKISINMDTIYHYEEVDTSLELFGKKFKYPVFAGPVGAVKIHYSDLYDDLTYSQALVKGCKEAGIAAFTGDGVEDKVFQGTIDAINDNSGWGISTIKPWSKEEVIKKIKIAETANPIALAMDIDAAGLSILAAQGKPVAPMSVETIKEIVDSTELPFLLKGVMTVEGAKKALETGAYGIIVSNHGGRVLDETPSSISVLPEIVKAVGGKMKIIIDGGFRSGNDIFKAIAMGADGVIIARPYAIALYGGDVEGIVRYTEKIGEELKNTMTMTGAKTLKDIKCNMIRF
jgi:isopentenyl diphosphate isomerase/L-lactate dehydrogenase-like FMN-dependent dehydrogenase